MSAARRGLSAARFLLPDEEEAGSDSPTGLSLSKALHCPFGGPAISTRSVGFASRLFNRFALVGGGRNLPEKIMPGGRANFAVAYAGKEWGTRLKKSVQPQGSSPREAVPSGSPR